jgi:hypothetical protein
MGSARFVFKYLLYLAVVMLAVNGVFYWFFISKIHRAAENARYDAVDERWVDPTTMLNLGWVSPARSSSFVHFSPQKPPGVVRIGCIGDSYTYGDEVGPNEDYPTLLQKLFVERGYENVQVINFGSSFYGFHQSFILWKFVARRYALDVVILGPRSFYHTREAHMNHPGVPLAVHARYIVDGGQARLIPVLGTTKDEVVARYHSFIPERRYLKYDLDPPAFLKALIPGGRRLRNPFYYHSGTIKDEINQTYRALLAEMASDPSTQIILSNFDREIAELGRSVDKPNIHSLPLTKNWQFPNVMQRRHYSVHGNELLAHQYFREVTGSRRDVSRSIEFTDLPLHVSEEETSGLRSPLVDLEQIGVHVGAMFAGMFQYDDSNLLEDAERRPYSLLAIKGRDSSVLDAIFVPLEFQIDEDSRIWLRAGRSETSAEETIGKVRWLTDRFNIGVVETDAFEPVWVMSPFMTLAESVRANHPDATEFGLYLDDHLISTGVLVEREGAVEFRAVRGDFAKIRSAKGSRLSFDRLEDVGTVSLVATRADESRLVAPIASYRLSDLKADVELDSLSRQLGLRSRGPTASQGSSNAEQ